MLKKTMTYTDFDGNSRTEDFYFNLTTAEVAEMELSRHGGIVQHLYKIVQTEDPPELLAAFKDLILRSYGEKSPDGRRFIKNQELRDGFSQTEAYSDLFLELVNSSESAAAFVNGIIPSPK